MIGQSTSKISHHHEVNNIIMSPISLSPSDHQGSPSMFEKINTAHQDQKFSENLHFKITDTMDRARTDLKSRIVPGFLTGNPLTQCVALFSSFFWALTRPCGFAPDFQLISSPWRKPGVTIPKAVWNKSIHSFISIQILKSDFTRFSTFLTRLCY